LFQPNKQHFSTNKSTIHFHVPQGMHILQVLQSLMNIAIPLTFFIQKSNHSLIKNTKESIITVLQRLVEAPSLPTHNFGSTYQVVP